MFQGDLFSPLLFAMAVIPFTMILRQVNAGYRFSGSREKVNHFLFMDDLKLYDSCDEELESVVGVVKMFSDNVGMKYGFDMCGVLVVEKDVKKKCEEIELPGGEMIREINENGYKYLGVLEAENILEKEMKEKLKSEYFRHVKLLSRSKFYGGKAIKGINS